MSLYEQFVQDLMTLKRVKPSLPNMGYCPQCGWNEKHAKSGQFSPAEIDPADCEHCNPAECTQCGRKTAQHDGEEYICDSCHSYKWGVEE